MTKWLLHDAAGDIRPLYGDQHADAVTIGVIAGADVALHRLILAATTTRRRLEEARLYAVDLAAQPLDDLHVAVGPADATGASWVAIIAADRMEAHLAAFTAAGIEPAHLVPAPLLLAEDTNARLDELHLFHTADLAGAVEPRLAHHLGLDGVVAAPMFNPAIDEHTVIPLDLLQGAFARRRRWWADRGFRRAVLVLAVLALLLLAAPFAITRLRQASADAGNDRATVALAVNALGDTLGKAAPDQAAAAASALAKARADAEGAAIAARLTFVLQQLAASDAPTLHLAGVHQQGDALNITLGGPAAAINRLGTALTSGPFVARQQGADILIAGRQPPPPNPALRLAMAQGDAAILAHLKKARILTTPAEIPAAIRRMADAAGLGDAVVTPTPAGAEVEIPAARAHVLLPLLGRLELAGVRIADLVIQPGDDPTLVASFAARIGASS